MAEKIIINPSSVKTRTGFFTQLSNFILKNWIIIFGIIIFGMLAFFVIKYLFNRLENKKETKVEELKKMIIRTAKIHARKEYVKNWDLIKLIFVSFGFLISVLFLTYRLIHREMAIVDYWVMNIIIFVLWLFIYGILKLIPIFKKRANVYLNPLTENPIYVGKYYGDYISSDGYHNILISRYSKWLIIPQIEIIRVNATGEITIKEKRGRKEIIKRYKIPKNLVKFYKDRIEIIGYSLDRIGTTPFLTNVLKDKDGNIIDLRYIDMSRLKDTITIDTIKDIAEQFANAVNRIPELNPTIQYVVNTGQENIRKPIENDE